ncbi:hypothetical protein [Paraburkholderia terrae]|uniref:hypothetical protein n=1 Tax=Paraburkholderia terrae TaxID=311230 RepID=UPI000AE5FC6B|nr:hypothetical protein [Paraburkholderia terrae]
MIHTLKGRRGKRSGMFNLGRKADFESSRACNGLQYGQMPHESVFSTFARFCALNVLDSTRKAELGDVRLYRTPKLFGFVVEINVEGIEAATGWTVSDVQLDLSRTIPNAAGLVFTTSIRVCYSCLAHGFHSTWHQFRLLRECPIHHEELSTTCLCCNQDISQAFSGVPRTLGVAPLLRCPHCDISPAFLEFSLERHDVFRRSAGKVVEAFAPLKLWFDEARSIFQMIDALVAQNLPRAWVKWCDPEIFLLSVLHRLHPFPDIIDCAQLLPIGMQTWAQTSATEFNNRRYRGASRSIPHRGVYSAVLRRFNRWIFGEDAPSVIRFDLEQLFGPDGLNSETRDELGIALVLFRAWYEALVQSPSKWADPTAIVLRGRLPFNGNQNFSRNAQKAILLGSFAVFVNLIRTRGPTVYRAEEFVADEISLVQLLPMVLSGLGDWPHANAVFYPRPDMP